MKCFGKTVSDGIFEQSCEKAANKRRQTWMLWMPHSRAHFVCQNDFWANICANVLRNPYPATGRYVPVQFSKFYHWKYSCEVFLLCMMMMIGQMMKLRKQARSIWQRGALEWWSRASALSADGYCTNTILSDIDFYIYQYWSDTDFHLHIFKADIDIHLVAFQMRELAL